MTNKLEKERIFLNIIKDQKLLQTKINNYQLVEFIGESHHTHMKLVHLEKGDSIYCQDEEIDYLCFFLSGKIKIYRTLSNGKENIVNVIHNFSLLGEIELISRKKSLTSVEVLEHSECIVIPVEYCRQELLNDVTFLQKISYNMAMTMHSVDVNLSINLFFPLENRVASYILSSEKNGSFNCDLTTLPERLGTTYRHFLRILKQFQEAGVIKKTEEDYTILNWAFLEEKVGDFYSF